jgi:hypothetical protein
MSLNRTPMLLVVTFAYEYIFIHNIPDLRKKQICPYAQLLKHYAMKAYGGSGFINPRVLDLITDWWVVSFTS